MTHKEQDSLNKFYDKSQQETKTTPTESQTIAIQEEQQIAYNIVLDILKSDTRARNQDLWLILKVWQQAQQIKIFVPFDKLKDMIMPETITRVRRRIQNTEEKYLPTEPEVLLKRRVKEEVLRKYYAGNDRMLNQYGIEKAKRSK